MKKKSVANERVGNELEAVSTGTLCCILYVICHELLIE